MGQNHYANDRRRKLLIFTMKKRISMVIILGTVIIVSALPTAPFQGLHDLIEKSPDIIVAKCIATQDLLQPQPALFYGNVCNSDIEVVSVLKGNSKPGQAHMVSLYRPYRSEYFLAFATLSTIQTNLVYSAIEEYRIVPLLHFHGTNQLMNKSLPEQIGLLMTNRLNDLNEELTRDVREKQSIEQYLKIDSDASKPSKEPEEKPEKGPPKDATPFSF